MKRLRGEAIARDGGSIIALVFALAGSAAAGVATIGKKEKKQTRNIADSEVNKLAPGTIATVPPFRAV